MIGITSKVRGGLSVFFWEYDDVEEYEALEEANFLSSAFDLDVYVSESSPRHYHLISCDIMTHREVDRIQGYTTIEGDYLPLRETGLYRSDLGRRNLITRDWCALRVGDKGKTPKPKFIAVFRRGKRLKSLGHYRIFQYYCNFPRIAKNTKKLYVATGIQISVFNTGIGSKPKNKDGFGFFRSKHFKKSLNTRKTHNTFREGTKKNGFVKNEVRNRNLYRGYHNRASNADRYRTDS